MVATIHWLLFQKLKLAKWFSIEQARKKDYLQISTVTSVSRGIYQQTLKTKPG